MLGTSPRLFIFFNGPLSLFHHRPSILLRLTQCHSLTCPLPHLSAVPNHLFPPSRPTSLVPIKSSQQFHPQTASNRLQDENHNPADAYLVPPSHPWPEWSHLLESISTVGYVDGNSNMKDEFVPNESLSMEFVDAASSCLGFARNRHDILGSLPKKDIQVLIDDGAPFLFKSAIEIERRMRSFLQAKEPNEATTVDLMKYILSYASNPIIYPERSIREATESSARNLLREMANFSLRGPALDMSDIAKFPGVTRDEQTPRNLGPTITMKRGDWICPKCNFMNFAKNTKCLECEEFRPQRQLTGGEWDCPECNFFNYGRNVVCLRCECKRPGETPFPNGDDFWRANKNPETLFNARKDARFPIPKGTNSNYAPFVPLPANMFAKKPEKTTVDQSASSDSTATVSRHSEISANQIKDTAEEEKSERWFKKVAELHDGADVASVISDEDFPEIMPMRKGENRFVVSKKKDRSLTNTYKRRETMEQGSTGKFVPFVPFPPDYFAKKDDKQHMPSGNSSKATHNTNLVQETRNRESGSADDLNSRFFGDQKSLWKTSENQNGGSGLEGNSLEGSTVKETNPLDMLEEANATCDMNLGQETQNQETGSTNDLNSKFPGDRKTSNARTRWEGSSLEGSAVKKTNPIMNLGKETQNQETGSTNDLNSKFSGDWKTSNARSGWEGKSLEGSAVKETDPLDMSEEAKAERWFRRVAQIKNISELSQIPDEDFPSIMPMRKGVNRFVVSKRKTPLERRLTSPQYRKNLRDINSDPTKNEGDGS